jgi:hypothetical protein
MFVCLFCFVSWNLGWKNFLSEIATMPKALDSIPTLPKRKLLLTSLAGWDLSVPSQLSKHKDSSCLIHKKIIGYLWPKNEKKTKQNQLASHPILPGCSKVVRKKFKNLARCGGSHL